MGFPDELLESANGVAVFFNPEEGHEIMVEFNDVVSGLKKRGRDLTEDEEWALRGIVESPAISPAFIQRLAAEYGDESIAAAYLVRPPHDRTCLAYLLRRYKGVFYRRRYPAVTLIV
jgi:hypothetical protein